MNISNHKTSLKYRFTSQWVGCPETLYRVHDITHPANLAPTPCQRRQILQSLVFQ
jgi:hypothetical protein